jgi:hypothetical protein
VYDLGAFRIRAEAWPPAWIDRADQWLRRVDVDVDAAQARGEGAAEHAEHAEHAELTLAFAGHGLSADDSVDATSTGELLQERRAGPSAWELRSAGSFVAHLDEEARRIVIRARSESDDPMLPLSNVLRGSMATTIATLRNGLMIHACAGIIDDDDASRVHGAGAASRAGIFVAGVSTAGKTTLALGFHDTTYLSDDVALVVNADTSPLLVPSPFFGAAGVLGANESAPLRAVGILVDKAAEGAPSTYERVSRARGAFELMRHVARFADDRKLSERLFSLATSLAERVPVVLVKRSLATASDDVVRRIMQEARC